MSRSSQASLSNTNLVRPSAEPTKPIKLDDLLNDSRMDRLFSEDERHCALQLWILQIRHEQKIESRILYGRLLPYSYSSNSWSFPNDDNFITFGQAEVQVIRINLYLKSTRCRDLLRQLCAGQFLSTITQELDFSLSDKFEGRFGSISLIEENLAYRPVTYLLNRDANERDSLSSPHGGSGALSASITQIDKGTLFRIGHDYDVQMTASVINSINADTGLDFGGTDATRFGDIELLVFPALDDKERSLLQVDWTYDPVALVVRFHPIQVPNFNNFQFCLSINNDGQIIYSIIATAARDNEGVFEFRFRVSDHVRAATDNAELQIFGFCGDAPHEGTLCCRWRIGYVREININGHLIGSPKSPFKFDWLEKTKRPATTARTQAALTRNPGDEGFASHIGGRSADPWVPVNRDLVSLFKRLHPPKSEGQFFLRWGQGDGEGRLQFVEWFKALFAKYPQHQVVIFDPYFEDVGLGLLLLCVQTATDYIVFRTLPKPVKADKPHRRNSDSNNGDGVNNLLANCERNSHLLKNIKLRIYGLKEGRLHDRYILVMGSDQLPVAGFNLSNSFQKAAENYPMLVTPIPADVLLKVEQYKYDLVQEAKNLRRDNDSVATAMELIFDSTNLPKEPRRYEPLRFLEKTKSGDALSVWIGEPSLQGLSGDQLSERMVVLGLIKGTSLALPESAGFRNCLDKLKGNIADFSAIWEVLGEVLANSSAGDRHFQELESEHGFLAFLARYLEASFSRVYDGAKKELSVMDSRLFSEPIEALLHSSYRPDHFLHATKYTALTWSEYYTIKFLWWYTPDVLLAIAEPQMTCMSVEPQETEVVRLSLLSQIISEIALSVQINLSEAQRRLLTHSNKGFLQWLGLNAIEQQLEKPEGVTVVQQLLDVFPHHKQIQFLGWMVHRAAGIPERSDVYNSLVASLHDTLPEMISADELNRLVNSMRGHMRQLAWTGSWLFQDVIFPLLKNNRTNTDDACKIWINELVTSLGPEVNHRSRLFDCGREGVTTNIAAFLFAYSSSEQQNISVQSMQSILKKQQRIVQQPLASTSNWTLWNEALIVSMWILAFTRWSQYYLHERGITSQELEALSQGAQKLAMVRPMNEWRSEAYTGQRGELAAFLDQADELLTNRLPEKLDE